MVKQHHTGGRMQNYYPTPVRYTVSSGDVEDYEWGARLAGILYIVLGGVMLIMPLIQTLGRGVQLFFSIFGIPASMTETLTVPAALIMGGLLLLIGAGVILRYGPMFFPAMAVAFFLFMPSFPIGTAVGCALVYVLWQGMPRTAPIPKADPQDPDASKQ
ncbi:MAG: hypothetical protein PVJ49_16855 [Acidobacteriota bacterium]|jgi:hypothetical protein